MRAQLVVRGDTGLDQVGAGADEHPQPEGGRGVEGQRGEASAVGAQHVGQQVGVEAVVLVSRAVPRAAVAGAQGGDLAAGDDEHGQAGVEQGLHDRAVTALDRHSRGLVAVQQGDQFGQSGSGVAHGEPLECCAGLVDHAGGVVGPGPVHPGPPQRPVGFGVGFGLVAGRGGFWVVHCGVGSRPGRVSAAGRRGCRSVIEALVAHNPIAGQHAPSRRASRCQGGPRRPREPGR